MLRFIIFVLVLFLILYLTDRLLDPEEAGGEEDDWASLEHRVRLPVLGRGGKGGERKSACHFSSQDCFDVYRCSAGLGQLKGSALYSYILATNTQV